MWSNNLNKAGFPSETRAAGTSCYCHKQICNTNSQSSVTALTRHVLLPAVLLLLSDLSAPCLVYNGSYCSVVESHRVLQVRVNSRTGTIHHKIKDVADHEASDKIRPWIQRNPTTHLNVLTPSHFKSSKPTFCIYQSGLWLCSPLLCALGLTGEKHQDQLTN